MVGILASVAVAHAVLAIALMTGGGCRQTKILAPHTYNNGPQMAQVPGAADAPAEQEVGGGAPAVPGGDAPVAPPPVDVPVSSYVPPVAPVAPVAPAAPATRGVKSYKVKKGDNLSKIAHLHGVRVRDLAACNNLSGKAMNFLRVGQVLTIPEGGVYYDSPKAKNNGKKAAGKGSGKKGKRTKAAPAKLPADGIYVVKSGDSLDRIGRRYGVSARAIAKENNIALTKILHIGYKLRIPGKASVAAKPAPADEKPVVESTSGAAVNKDILDDLDPNAGLSSTAGSAAATETAATDTASASPVESSSVSTSATSTKTESMEVISDMTVEEFCRRNMVKVEDIRRLNPDLPADGKLKGGSYVSIPSLD